jgi:dimethylargininase
MARNGESVLTAITREVSRSIVYCELTFLERIPIDVERAREQHAQYRAALKFLGLNFISLPEEPNMADSVFVEDTALILDECALITRPGAVPRRRETESIAKILERYRKLFYIKKPAHIDGGDILCVGKDIYVGLSERSDILANDQMHEYLQPLGYKIHSVQVTGCLHLKSAVTQISQDTLLINPEWVDKKNFRGMKCLEIDPSEPYAANALLVEGTIIYPKAFPKTQERLETAGIRMITVDADELAKAEGAVTCCSLIFKN